MPAGIGRRRGIAPVRSALPPITSPADLTGLHGWWDASQIAGAVDNTTIASWPDLSGNGRNFAQATAGTRPTYLANQLGAGPAVNFSGAQWMSTAAFTAMAQPYTIFAVARPATGGDRDILGGNNTTSFQRFRLRAHNAGTYRIWAAGAGVEIAVAGNNGTKRTLAAVVKGGTTGDGNVSRLRVNAVESTAQGLGTEPLTILTVGAGNIAGSTPLTGDVMKVIVYSRELTTAEITRVEAYLQ